MDYEAGLVERPHTRVNKVGGGVKDGQRCLKEEKRCLKEGKRCLKEEKCCLKEGKRCLKEGKSCLVACLLSLHVHNPTSVPATSHI